MIKIDVSIGELVDKVSILFIKSRKIEDREKLRHIHKEFELLNGKMESIGITVDSPEFRRLEEVNLKLWDAEDWIRLKEDQKIFDQEFIFFARSIYINNDERARIKREINFQFGSELIEEKVFSGKKNIRSKAF